MYGRVFKQLAYGGSFLFVCGAIVLALYFLFFKPIPTCFDGRQNGDEQGIDCGSSCSNVCLSSQFQSLPDENVAFVFFPDESHISVVSKLSNPNNGYAIRSLPYVFRLTDDQGRTLQIPGKTFLYAKDVKYVDALETIQSNFNFRHITNAALVPRISQSLWVKADTFIQPPVKLQQQQTIQDGGYVRVSGKIVNDDTITLPTVGIIAVFFGKFGQVLGVSHTQIDAVAPSDMREFSIIHPVMPNINLEATKIYVSAYRP